jgi:hypothetical protein
VPRKKLAGQMIEIGTLDDVVSVFGAKKTGKSTWALREARRFQLATGGYVIGHSPNGQIGRASDVEFSRDVETLARRLARHPEKIHVVTTGAPEDVLDYGRAMARALRERAVKKAGHWRFDPHSPAPPGVMAPPVLVIYDEGIAMQENPSREESMEFQRFLTSTRHEHMAFMFLNQAPSKRAWMIAEQSRRVIMFRYLHEWGANSIRAAGIPQETVLKLKTLPRFEYLYFDADKPGVIEHRKLPPPNSRQPDSQVTAPQKSTAGT